MATASTAASLLPHQAENGLDAEDEPELACEWLSSRLAVSFSPRIFERRPLSEMAP
jgi:hypothetical protein